MFECEAGAHPLDPLSRSMQAGGYAEAAARPRKPQRVAYSVDLGVAPVVDREVRSETKLFSYGAYLEQLFGLAGRLLIDPISK